MDDKDRPMTREELLKARAEILEQQNELQKVPLRRPANEIDDELGTILEEINDELAKLDGKGPASG